MALLSVVTMGAQAGADGGAVITGSPCFGSTDTLSWPAQSVPNLTGYHIMESNDTNPSQSQTFDVGPETLSLQFSATANELTFTIFTAISGHPGGQFASVHFSGKSAPSAMPWDFRNPQNSVAGDRSVTVAFRWLGDVPLRFLTGNDAVSVTVTASLGGAQITSVPVPAGPDYVVTDTFTGLTNGVPYTFSAVVTNTCGSAGPTQSPSFTPTGPSAGALTCVVVSTQVPPAVPQAQQSVQVQAADGLAKVNHINVTNGSVNVAAFTPGTTDPVIVTATKTHPRQPTTWSFDITDTNGQTKHCA